jgi:hypothetical protein
MYVVDFVSDVIALHAESLPKNSQSNVHFASLLPATMGMYFRASSQESRVEAEVPLAYSLHSEVLA